MAYHYLIGVRSTIDNVTMQCDMSVDSYMEWTDAEVNAVNIFKLYRNTCISDNNMSDDEVIELYKQELGDDKSFNRILDISASIHGLSMRSHINNCMMFKFESEFEIGRDFDWAFFIQYGISDEKRLVARVRI